MILHYESYHYWISLGSICDISAIDYIASFLYSEAEVEQLQSFWQELASPSVAQAYIKVCYYFEIWANTTSAVTKTIS